MFEFSPIRGFRGLFAIMLIGVGIGAGTLLAGIAPAFAADLEIASIRLGNHQDYTRFVLDMSSDVKPRVFTLADPYRVVIDLPEAKWKTSENAGRDGKGLVRGYRYGLFRPGNSRIVLDMSGPAKVGRIFTLKPSNGKGHRLVVDLEAVERDVFLASAGWPKEDRMNVPPVKSIPLRDTKNEQRRDRYVIAIDPGHGGIDPGAIGQSGLQEKAVSLGVARKLQAQLLATGRYDVIMTRDRDIFHSLRERVAMARSARADLFISLHADTIENRTVRGASIYTLSETASDSEADELANKENRADIIAGVDTTEVSSEISMILIELSQREAKNRSAHFADLLTPRLERETRLLRNTHRFAGFRVLKAPDVPSVLIELGYMSNQQDEKNLKSASWQKRVAGSIATSIDDYFKSEESGQMRQAWVQ